MTTGIDNIGLPRSQPPTSPPHHLPALPRKPALPSPNKDPEIIASPVSNSGSSKHFPKASPNIGNSHCVVRIPEMERKHFATDYSFLSGSSTTDHEGIVFTSTPLKPPKLSQRPRVRQSMFRTNIPTIGESCEGGTTMETENGHETNSGILCSVESKCSKARPSNSQHAILCSSKEMKSPQECQNKQGRSKISPSTMKKLKQFAFMERPSSSESKRK